MAKCDICGKGVIKPISYGGKNFCGDCWSKQSKGVLTLPPAQKTPAQTVGGGGTQKVEQKIEQKIELPTSTTKSVVMGIVGMMLLAVGWLVFLFLMNFVKIGPNLTIGQFIWSYVSQALELTEGYEYFIGFILVFIIGIGFLIAIFRSGRHVFRNFADLVTMLNATLWMANGILITTWIAMNLFNLAPTQISCFFAGGDITACSTQQQPVGSAEQGVFESPMKIDYGLWDYENKRIISLTNPTTGQKYYPAILLQPKTDYESDVNGVVINMVGKTAADETVDFAGKSCTSESTCTIDKDNKIPIADTFESSDAIPCGSRFLTLYSQIYYPVEGARNGYHVRLVRSDDDLGTSLASDIGKASKIYGPVDFALGFSPGQHVVIPKSGMGEVIVYIYASNEYRGVASLKNIMLTQEPERSGSDVYKLNLVSCDPIMPSTTQDSKGNIYYTFDTPIDLKPTQQYQTGWDWGSVSTTSTVKKSQITCTFQIPFSLRETSSYFKTVTFDVGGSYTYSEEIQSDPLTVWDTC